MSDDLATARLVHLIATDGPISVSRYLEEALYGPAGFYMVGGRAGRRGDFLTAPEVGPLFGAVVAGAVDLWWDEQGRPESFTVLEWGAGPGTLARSVLAAAPEALTSGALEWILIERAEAQRAQHPEHPQVRSVAGRDPTMDPVEHGLVLANELLDNLPFDIYERRADGWAPVLVTVDPSSPDRFTTVLGLPVPSGEPHPADVFGRIGPDLPIGSRLPLQADAQRWVTAARASIDHGRVIVFDYGATTTELADRGTGWLRTHRDHAGTADWLTAPGTCDITADVDVDQLQVGHAADRHERQAEWLERHGIEALVEEGRAQWARSAGIGDLAALKARSRVREAEALTDPTGMGAFHVLEWRVGDVGGV